MKISPVNGNTQQNKSFNGKFVYNSGIRELVDSANETELARFRNALYAMSRVKDGLRFSIDRTVKFYKRDDIIGFVAKYKLITQKGIKGSARELVTVTSDSFSYTPNKLSVITTALEEFYLRTEKKSRTELQDDILNMMA